MKTKILYALLVLALFLNSCSKDDNSIDLLVGSWFAVEGSYNGNNYGPADHNIIKFTSSNRAVFIYEGFGNRGEDISEVGDWEKNGEMLNIIWDESDPGLEILELEILKLTSTKLIWKDKDYGHIEIYNRR